MFSKAVVEKESDFMHVRQIINFCKFNSKFLIRLLNAVKRRK